ncbi:MAG: cytochrome c, partial [Deltaproteobacteria bacterium]
GEQDLREFIQDGAPRRKREDADYRAKVEAATLRMPAYRAFLSTSQVDDLVAFLRATSGQILPDEALAARGAERAAELGCFACHGPLGAGGVSNPGSFKGYIPGFWGADFDELVRDDGELRQWIAEGGIPRISEHPIGRIFVRRQVIKMPAFGHGHVQSPEDIDALMAYLRWIRAGSWKSLTRVAAGG